MSASQNIFRIIRPFLKGWPIMAIGFFGGLAIGLMKLYYAIPSYQSGAAIQINDKESGASTFLKNFETFAITGPVLAEVEVLKSKYLVGKALEKLPLEIWYFRYIRTNPRQLYKTSPFKVVPVIRDSSWLNELFDLEILPAGELILRLPEQEDFELRGKVGEPMIHEGFTFTILPDTFDATHARKWEVGEYAFKIPSKSNLISAFANHKLMVMQPEKEVPIVRIYFQHEVPEVVADFVNVLAETYIEDFVENKKKTATKALNFIDEQIAEVEGALRKSEAELAQFKGKSQIVDLEMETDARLKQLGDLEVRKLNNRLRLTELEALLNSVQRDSLPEQLSSAYESIEDPTFTDALLRIQEQTAEKEKLLQKFTKEYPDVVQIEEELSRTRNQLIEGIQSTIKAYEGQQVELEAESKAVTKAFGRLPQFERDLLVLQRRYVTNEQLYNFLIKKRAEAAIGAVSTISFHKILETSPIPKEPIAPSKSLYVGLGSIVGLILGFGVVFLRRYLKSKVFDSASIENQIDLPVLAELRSLPKEVDRISQDVINLATNIHLVQEVSMITVGAYGAGSGKRKAALNLAKAMAAIGYRTILVDADLYDSRLHKYLHRGNDRGLSQVLMGQTKLKSAIQVTDLPHLDLLAAGRFSEEIPTRLILHPSTQQVFDTLREQYDRIVVAVPDLKDVRDAIPLMKASEVNLLTAWTDKTSMRDLAESEALLRKFQVPNLYCLLIRATSQLNQSTYSVSGGTLPPIGHGARRAALKRWLKRIIGRS